MVAAGPRTILQTTARHTLAHAHAHAFILKITGAGQVFPVLFSAYQVLTDETMKAEVCKTTKLMLRSFYFRLDQHTLTPSKYDATFGTTSGSAQREKALREGSLRKLLAVVTRCETWHAQVGNRSHPYPTCSMIACLYQHKRHDRTTVAYF